MDHMIEASILLERIQLLCCNELPQIIDMKDHRSAHRCREHIADLHKNEFLEIFTSKVRKSNYAYQLSDCEREYIKQVNNLVQDCFKRFHLYFEIHDVMDLGSHLVDQLQFHNLSRSELSAPDIVLQCNLWIDSLANIYSQLNSNDSDYNDLFHLNVCLATKLDKLASVSEFRRNVSGVSQLENYTCVDGPVVKLQEVSKCSFKRFRKNGKVKCQSIRYVDSMLVTLNSCQTLKKYEHAVNASCVDNHYELSETSFVNTNVCLERVELANWHETENSSVEISCCDSVSSIIKECPASSVKICETKYFVGVQNIESLFELCEANVDTVDICDLTAEEFRVECSSAVQEETQVKVCNPRVQNYDITCNSELLDNCTITEVDKKARGILSLDFCYLLGIIRSCLPSSHHYLLILLVKWHCFLVTELKFGRKLVWDSSIWLTQLLYTLMIDMNNSCSILACLTYSLLKMVRFNYQESSLKALVKCTTFVFDPGIFQKFSLIGPHVYLTCQRILLNGNGLLYFNEKNKVFDRGRYSKLAIPYLLHLSLMFTLCSSMLAFDDFRIGWPYIHVVVRFFYKVFDPGG